MSKKLKGPKDYNHDPFCCKFLAKLEENSKNYQKILFFYIFFVHFEGFSNFLPFWLKTSRKTDHSCNP